MRLVEAGKDRTTTEMEYGLCGTIASPGEDMSKHFGTTLIASPPSNYHQKLHAIKENEPDDWHAGVYVCRGNKRFLFICDFKPFAQSSVR